MQTIQVECYGDLISLAESVGFIEPPEFDAEWTPELSEGLEALATEFLNENGISPLYDY